MAPEQHHSEEKPPVLAFIYDRHATPDAKALNERIAACRGYAAKRGWEVAGQYIDYGANAIGGRRPALKFLAAEIGYRASFDRTAVCLVHDWDRISRDADQSLVLRRRITLVGGHCVTIDGVDDTGEGAGRGLLSAPISVVRYIGEPPRRIGREISPGAILTPPSLK